MKTNYETLRDEKLKDPEFRARYFFAKEKLDLELMIDSIKEGVRLHKPSTVLIRRINKLSKHVSNLNML